MQVWFRGHGKHAWELAEIKGIEGDKAEVRS